MLYNYYGYMGRNVPAESEIFVTTCHDVVQIFGEILYCLTLSVNLSDHDQKIFRQLLGSSWKAE